MADKLTYKEAGVDTVNEKIPNGAIPDAVLPFSVKQDEARDAIEAFVKKRRFFANGKFKKEFSTENVMGVYFPYMLVDINGRQIGRASCRERV